MASTRETTSSRSARKGTTGRVAVAVAVLLMASLAPNGLGTSPAGAQTAGEGTWETTASLSVPRYDHTTTLLASGKVLAAAGRTAPGSGGELLASTEVYDPHSERWRETGSLQEARWSHTATLLPDGRVLVAGGFGEPYQGGSNAQPVLDTAEVYDPRTGTWSQTGSMTTRRALHTAILLPDGRVLVAGGRTCDQPPPTACNFTFRSDTAEIYDPTTGTWTPTGSLTIHRHTTSSVLLPSGEVLVPAGFTSAGNGTTADRYDPGTGTWSSTSPLNVGRARQGAMLLPDGTVLVASGFGGGNTAETYDPASDTWTLTGNMAGNRFNFDFAVLPNGKALVAGGGFSGQGPSATAELFDPATRQWSSAGEMPEVHGSTSSLSSTQPAIVLSSNPWTFEARPQACAPNCGKVLVVGDNPTGAAALYTPACPTTWPRPPQQLACDGGRRPPPGKPAGTPGRGPQPHATGGAATAP